MGSMVMAMAWAARRSRRALGRRAKRRLGLGLILFGSLVTPQGMASAQTGSCTYDAFTGTVSIQTAPGSPDNNYFGSSTLSVMGDAIWFAPSQCDGATLSNTDSIEVVGTPYQEALTIHGVFAPGRSPESEGEPEIEITIDFGNSPNDNLGVFGTDAADRLTIGAFGLAVNDDLDLDVTVTGVDYILGWGMGGDDLMSARGGLGTGDPSPVGVQLVAEGGNDRVLDGLNDDSLGAGRGQDVVMGGTGDDFVKGGAGNDQLAGGKGADVLRAGKGDDRCKPGPGKDLAAKCERPASLFGESS
jgi:Ca2+-binding RTX toxin-like protein